MDRGEGEEGGREGRFNGRTLTYTSRWGWGEGCSESLLDRQPQQCSRVFCKRSHLIRVSCRQTSKSCLMAVWSLGLICVCVFIRCAKVLGKNVNSRAKMHEIMKLKD